MRIERGVQAPVFAIEDSAVNSAIEQYNALGEQGFVNQTLQRMEKERDHRILYDHIIDVSEARRPSYKLGVALVYTAIAFQFNQDKNAFKVSSDDLAVYSRNLIELADHHRRTWKNLFRFGELREWWRPLGMSSWVSDKLIQTSPKLLKHLGGVAKFEDGVSTNDFWRGVQDASMPIVCKVESGQLAKRLFGNS